MSSKIALCKVNQYLPISKLKFHPNNPRTIKPERLEQLKTSIIEKGFYQPILVWKKGGIVLSGNHRLLAVQELMKEGFTFTSPMGDKDVLPVVVEDVTEEVAEAILYETNNFYAEWVEDTLRTAIQSAEDAGRNITGFGFDQSYIDGLLSGALKGAEESLKGETERSIEPVDGAKLGAALGEDEYASLILPKDVWEQLTGILGRIAKAMNKDWQPGDSYGEAAQVLCQGCLEAGVVDDLEDLSKPKLVSEAERKKVKAKVIRKTSL